MSRSIIWVGREAELRGLVAENLSASEIAVRLGEGFSRNMVMAKCRRLGVALSRLPGWSSGRSNAGVGKKPRGGLEGENAEDRDRRVADFILANPTMTVARVSSKLGVPFTACERIAINLRNIAKEAPRGPVFMPPAKFIPSPMPAQTPEARIAAVPANELQAIAARYGAVVRQAEAA